MIEEIEIPLEKATNENLKGYGYLIDSFENSDIEIVTWPKQGWRDIEEGTGNEGGTTEGSFDTWWQDDGWTFDGHRPRPLTNISRTKITRQKNS